MSGSGEETERDGKAPGLRDDRIVRDVPSVRAFRDLILGPYLVHRLAARLQGHCAHQQARRVRGLHERAVGSRVEGMAVQLG